MQTLKKFNKKNCGVVYIFLKFNYYFFCLKFNVFTRLYILNIFYL